METLVKPPVFSDAMDSLSNALQIIAAAADQVSKHVALQGNKEPVSDLANALRQAAADGSAALANLALIVQPSAMVIQADRAVRLWDTYFDIYNSNVSLRSAIKLLPEQPNVGRGEIDVAMTVDAFTTAIGAAADKMMDILNGDEKEGRS